MEFSSKQLEKAVNQMAMLPGVGVKTALRLVLHLLNEDEATVTNFGEIFKQLKSNVKQCQRCANISDESICSICANPLRDKHTICIVEDVRVVMNIENAGQYRGMYHVTNGLISPMNGIGPSDLNIESVIYRIQNEQISEIILALSPTMEGDTTAFYISKKLKGLNIKLSTIATGVAFGGELEYADELTLAKSINNRIPYGQ